MPMLPLALQLYTVRDQMAKDFAGTLRKVAQIGYKSVELSDTGGLSAHDLKVLLSDLDLRAVGPHTGIAELSTDLDRVLDYYSELGCPYITCPFMPEEYRAPARFGDTCELLNRVGDTCQRRGFQFCYHNHAFEFQTRIGDKTLFDALYDNTDPKLVKGEIDVYWVKYGGYDPVDTIAKRPGRYPLIHLKDMTPGEPTWAEVGAGILDTPAILTASEKSGAKWYVVEQDRCKGSSLASAKLSFDNLRKMGRA